MLIAIVEARRIRSEGGLDALCFFNGAYFLFFVFVPLNVLLLGEVAVRQKYAFQNWAYGDLWTGGALIISYIAFVFGYFRRVKTRSIIRIELREQIVKTAYYIAGCFCIIGCLAMSYHISLVGGLLKSLQVAPVVRTGEYPLEGKFLFIRQFTYFLSTAFMLAWVIHIDAIKLKNKLSTLNWMLLFLFGAIFVYYALSTYSRREFMYPMIICLIIWVLARQPRKWTGLIFLMVLTIIWFVSYSIIPAAWTAFQTGVDETVTATETTLAFVSGAYIRTLQGLGDSFMHFVAAQQANLWQFGFLADIWELPLQFVPSRLLGFERPRGMFGETSEFILGRPLESGLAGEEPLGLHGYLLVNFSYPGMFLAFYLMGIGYRFLNTILRPDRGGSALSWLMFVWVIVGTLEFLREGVLILILKPRFSWWLAMSILLWSSWRLSKRQTSFCNTSKKEGNS